MSPRARLGIGALLLAAMGLFVGLRLEITNELTHFLSAGDDLAMAKLSRRLADSELTRSMILSIEHEDRTQAMAAADTLGEALREHPEVAWVRSRWDEENDATFRRLYFPRRLHFLSDQGEDLLEVELSEAGLRARARALKRELGLPTAPLIKPIAPADPLLAFPAQLRRLEATQTGSLSVDNGYFVSESGHVIVFVASAHSPFQGAHQGPLQRDLDQWIRDLEDELGSSLVVEQSGVGRFALQAESTIRRDITRISVISTAGVVLLFLLVYRSPRMLLLALLPIGAGVLAALATCLLLFGRVHGLTLAFGASLIGVSLDYPVHLFNHHVLRPREGGAQRTLQAIRPGLLLGATTTVAGFVGLGWTSFPGVREIAIFASVGIASALATTLWLLPALLPDRQDPGPLHRSLADGMDTMLDALRSRRRALWILLALGVAVTAVGLPYVRFIDDVKALTRQDPELLEEDERVRARVSRMDAGRLVVSLAPDEETALRQNDAAFTKMVEAREAGEVEDFRSLHGFLWSAQLQRRNLEHTRGDPEFFTRLASAYEKEGFRGAAFGEFEQFLGEVPVAPLVFRDLVESPVGEAVRTFRTELDDEVGVFTFLRGVRDPAGLENRLEPLAGVHYFDQGALMSALYRRHRLQTMELVGVGLIAVFAMVFIRYRTLRRSLAAFLPALLAAGVTMAILGLAGQVINLLHVVSLLLVLSMGVDYGVFLAESAPQDQPATVLSLVIACASTVLAFGLLAMSTNPALRAIGSTTGLGVCVSLVLAPATLVLLAPRSDDEA